MDAGGPSKVHSTLDDVTAYREGSIGWASGRGYFEVDGQRVPLRLTRCSRPQYAPDSKGERRHEILQPSYTG